MVLDVYETLSGSQVQCQGMLLLSPDFFRGWVLFGDAPSPAAGEQCWGQWSSSPSVSAGLVRGKTEILSLRGSNSFSCCNSEGIITIFL